MDRGKAWTSVETALLSFSVPGSSLPLAQLHGRPHVSKTKHAAGAATITSISINQSSLAIAYPFFLCLSLSVTHRLNQSGTGPGRSLSPLSKKNRKGLHYCRRSRQTDRDTCSLVIKSQLSLSVFVHASRGFKRESRSVYITDASCFFVKRREEKQRNLGPLLFSEKSLQDGSRVFICEFYRLKFIYDKLYC